MWARRLNTIVLSITVLSLLCLIWDEVMRLRDDFVSRRILRPDQTHHETGLLEGSVVISTNPLENISLGFGSNHRTEAILIAGSQLQFIQTYPEIVSRTMVGLPFTATKALLSDLDHDGESDLVVTLFKPGLLNDSNGSQLCIYPSRSEPFKIAFSDYPSIRDVSVSDFNNDKTNDLLLALNDPVEGGISLGLNLGSMVFADKVIFSKWGVSVLAVGDFDSDGLVDFVAGLSSGQTDVWIFMNSGNGNFTARRLDFSSNLSLENLQLMTLDWDNDGDLDVLSLRGGRLAGLVGECNVLLNSGTGDFSRHQLFKFPNLMKIQISGDSLTGRRVVIVSQLESRPFEFFCGFILAGRPVVWSSLKIPGVSSSSFLLVDGQEGGGRILGLARGGDSDGKTSLNLWRIGK